MRESIAATDTGSRERLAAIDAAIRKENALNLTGTRFFKDLQQQRIETLRQATTEESKLQAEAGAEAASNEEKMGQLILAAEKEKQLLLNSIHRVSAQQIVQQETAAANQEYQIKMRAFAQEIAALDKHGKDYDNKLKAIQDKEKQLVQQHENDITNIRDKAEKERNSKILSAEESFRSAMTSSFTQLAMGHKSFAETMDSLGTQVVTGMLQNAMQMILTGKLTQIPNAEAAASAAYLAGVQAGGPMAPVVGALYAAEAFAAVMAFEGGGIVPGIGNGDIVPAMLTPGEGVVPGGVMEGLQNLVNSGGMGGRGNTTHLHFRPTYHLHALDGDSMDKVLQKHSATVSKHVQREIRKLNH